MLAAAVAALIWFDPVGHRANQADSSAIAVPDAPLAPSIDAAVVVDAESAVDAEVVAPELDGPPSAPLYTIEEALDDIAAGPLVFVGTGKWFGNFSIPACAYRNTRVIVVYEYCTGKEQPALGLIVLSPTRGRVKVYAEANSPISPLARADYATFRVEVERLFAAEPISLDLTFPEVSAWVERRSNAHIGACWSGDGDGCSSNVDAQPAWFESARTFLADPPSAWYQLAKDLHARAGRDRRRAPPPR